MASYIYPPRPRASIPPGDLDHYDNTGDWIAQPKYQGTRNLVHIDKGEVSLWSRHGTPHKAFSLSVSLKNEILALPGLEKGVEYWLDGELLYSKTKAIDTKGKIVLFDVLFAGKYLFLAPDQMGRIQMLDDICGNPRTIDPYRQMSYEISESLLMAPYFENKFSEHFRRFNYDEVEGLVLRRKNSGLDNFGRKEYLANWLVRCRRQSKVADF